MCQTIRTTRKIKKKKIENFYLVEKESQEHIDLVRFLRAQQLPKFHKLQIFDPEYREVCHDDVKSSVLAVDLRRMSLIQPIHDSFQQLAVSLSPIHHFAQKEACILVLDLVGLEIVIHMCRWRDERRLVAFQQPTALLQQPVSHLLLLFHLFRRWRRHLWKLSRIFTPSKEVERRRLGRAGLKAKVSLERGNAKGRHTLRWQLPAASVQCSGR